MMFALKYRMVATEVREGMAPTDFTDDDRLFELWSEVGLSTRKYLGSVDEGQETSDKAAFT